MATQKAIIAQGGNDIYPRTAADMVFVSEDKTVADVLSELQSSGYLYAGTASQSTDPGTPTQKVFYLAKEAGTYNYFGGIQIQQGITVIKYDAPNWTRTLIYGVDEAPASNSEALIKSGGVYAAIDNAKTVINYTNLRIKNGAIVLDFVSELLPAGIQAYQIYLNTSSNKLLQRNATNSGNIEITKTNGMLVEYNGVRLVYNSEANNWSACVPSGWSVPLLKSTKFVRWAFDSATNKMSPATTTNDWRSSLRIPIKKGDAIVAYGYGSTGTPLLTITDSSLNVLYQKSTWDVVAPTCVISEWDGYVFYNSLPQKDGVDVRRALYVSSWKNEVEILGIYDAVPNTYGVSFNIGDIFYRDGNAELTDTARFVMQMGSSRQTVTDGLSEFDFIYVHNEYKYRYINNHLVEVGQQKVLKYDIIDNLLSQTDIATEIAGLGFNQDDFYDDIHAKFDALVSAHPSVFTKVDAVTFANNNGASLSYPSYCNLDGEPSGDYLATPTYRTYLYKLSEPSNEGLKQRTYSKKYKVLIVSGIHGYEIAAPTDCYLFAKNILDGSIADKNLFTMRSNIEFYFLPCVNGYGIYHGGTGNYARTNANGVNINRNFPYAWEQSQPGVNYSGPSAGSEFETQLIMAIANAIQFDVCIDHHNFDKDNNNQYWLSIMRNNLTMYDVSYKTLCEVDYALKKNHPEYFGSNFGYIGQTPITLGIDGKTNGTAASWFCEGYGCKLSATFESSRGINYINGIYDGTINNDDYGSTLFSCNEYALRTLLEYITSNIKQVNK